MAEPTYTVFVRLPIPRGDFIDPPPVRAGSRRSAISLLTTPSAQVHWDATKDEALWKILSGATQNDIDCETP